MTIPNPLTGEIHSVAKEFGLTEAVLIATVIAQAAENERCGRAGMVSVRGVAAGIVAAFGAMEPPLLAEVARLEGERDRAIESHRDVARRKIVVAQWRDRFKARAEAAESALAACREENERLTRERAEKDHAYATSFGSAVSEVSRLTWQLNQVERERDAAIARALVEGGGA